MGTVCRVFAFAEVSDQCLPFAPRPNMVRLDGPLAGNGGNRKMKKRERIDGFIVQAGMDTVADDVFGPVLIEEGRNLDDFDSLAKIFLRDNADGV